MRSPTTRLKTYLLGTWVVCFSFVSGTSCIAAAPIEVDLLESSAECSTTTTRLHKFVADGESIHDAVADTKKNGAWVITRGNPDFWIYRVRDDFEETPTPPTNLTETLTESGPALDDVQLLPGVFPGSAWSLVRNEHSMELLTFEAGRGIATRSGNLYPIFESTIPELISARDFQFRLLALDQSYFLLAAPKEAKYKDFLVILIELDQQFVTYKATNLTFQLLCDGDSKATCIQESGESLLSDIVLGPATKSLRSNRTAVAIEWLSAVDTERQTETEPRPASSPVPAPIGSSLETHLLTLTSGPTGHSAELLPIRDIYDPDQILQDELKAMSVLHTSIEDNYSYCLADPDSSYLKTSNTEDWWVGSKFIPFDHPTSLIQLRNRVALPTIDKDQLHLIDVHDIPTEQNDIFPIALDTTSEQTDRVMDWSHTNVFKSPGLDRAWGIGGDRMIAVSKSGGEETADIIEVDCIPHLDDQF